MKPIGGGTSEKPQPEIGRQVEPESKEETAGSVTTTSAPSHHEDIRPLHEQQETVDEQQHEQPPKDHLKTVESQHPQTGSIDDTPIAAATTLEKKGTSSTETMDRPRQVIAVSASKGPAAFFNLARKFLITDKECDLSALEGAIVSAVDAAHLLERSKLAKITRVQTSYVTVEPKRKSQETTEAATAAGGGIKPIEKQTETTHLAAATTGTTSTSIPTTDTTISTTAKTKTGRKKGGSLRRARIVITVRRTEDYENWLVDNPHTYGGDDEDDEHDLSTPPMKS